MSADSDRPRAEMSIALSRALVLADEVEQFPLGKCGPSDDPDMQTAYLYGFRDVAKRFLASLRRIGDPDLSEQIAGLDPSPEFITGAYDLKADLAGIIDYLRDVAANPAYETGLVNNGLFVDSAIISQLGSARCEFDLTKLIGFCDELNDSYRRGNYLACALLIRAVMNHVPPIFGVQTFEQVVASSGRSVKALLGRLQDESRPIADLHTHILIRARESLPTKHQIEPYKAMFEILLHEILSKTEAVA